MHRVVAIAVFALALTANAQDRYIVKFKNASQGKSALRAAGGRIALELGRYNAAAAHIPPHALAALKSNPNIASIEQDPVRYPLAQSTPFGITLVQADQIATSSLATNRTVCIIDSGLWTGHEDLQTSNITGYPTGWDTDGCGHGTHVAGTIAALTNSQGVLGVLPHGVKLHIVKVFGNNCAWSYASSLIDALDRCQSAGANVVNMSLGGGMQSSLEETAFQDAWNAGVLSVAAAGNGGTTSLSYPASYSSVVSVAAVDSNKSVAVFSQYNNEVDLAAPGVGVMSTVPFKDQHTLTVDGSTFTGLQIVGATNTAGVTGALVDGGLCDSAGSWNGKIVLCKRGTTTFADKVAKVQSGGGVAAVVYNDVTGIFTGTLNGTSTLPAISLSKADGDLLVAQKLNQSATLVSQKTWPASGYEPWSGTSMATPHVTGVAALVWSQNTSWTNAQIRQALQATALDLGATGRDNYYGYGLVQAKAALTYLQGGTVNNAPLAAFSVSCSGLTCAFTDSSSDSDGLVTSWSWNFGDGSTSTAANPSRMFAAAGTYTVSLTVKDDDNATGTASKVVTVSIPNAAPVASFAHSCVGLTCTFSDASSDSDGSIVGWSWSFGDGTSSTAQHPVRTFGGVGTYVVSLTVTDDRGALASTSKAVTVTTSGTVTFSLTARGYKAKGKFKVDLRWSGATSTSVDVLRNGTKVGTTPNTGAATDNLVGSASKQQFTYEVCETGTTKCSNPAFVTFR